MAKAFKWLLPGAVKKTTTKKTTKSNRTLERNKKVQQRSDIQPFFSQSHSFTTHLCTSRLFSLTGNSLIPTLPHISLVKRNTVLNWGNTKTARHIPAFKNLKWQRNKLIWTSETKYVELDVQRRLSGLLQLRSMYQASLPYWPFQMVWPMEQTREMASRHPNSTRIWKLVIRSTLDSFRGGRVEFWVKREKRDVVKKPEVEQTIVFLCCWWQYETQKTWSES